MADCACILLCNDSWQKFKKSLLLVLGSSTVFMAEFACKKSYAFKGYFGDFFFFKQSYYESILESFRAFFQTGLTVKKTINEFGSK